MKSSFVQIYGDCNKYILHIRKEDLKVFWDHGVYPENILQATIIFIL